MKFDRIFPNIVATGDYAWTPWSRVLCDDNVGVDGNQNVNVDQPDLKEGNGDSEEDEIPNFTDDVCNMVRGVNMSTSSNTRSSDKRKERERCKVQAGEKKNSRIRLQLLSYWDQLVDNMSNNNDSTSICKDRKGCSIHEIISEFHSIKG